MDRKSHIFRSLSRISRGTDAAAHHMSSGNKNLIDRGLVKIWENQIILTEKGKQFMFQWQCEGFLKALQGGRDPNATEPVIAWLLKHQFMIQVRESESWQITPRGRDWLSQLE